MKREPKTLQEAILFFSDPQNCREYLIERRWPNGVICPRCGSDSVKFQEKYNRWQCGRKHSLRQFTLKTGTIFEDSPIGLDKWLTAMWMVVNCKNGISSYEIHRALGVTQKSAWFMDHRIRFALHQSDDVKMGGDGNAVEVDETALTSETATMGAALIPQSEAFWTSASPIRFSLARQRIFQKRTAKERKRQRRGKRQTF